MYRFTPCLTLGFHGCDKSIRDAIVNEQQTLKYSRNKYDWLGSGMYFWENDYDRALDFANNHPGRKINSPSVRGAVIDPGYCLNLLNTKDRELVRKAHEIIKNRIDSFEKKSLPHYTNNNGLHNLDCLVIENLHQIRQSLNQPPFESVRSAFNEGPELYPGAGFREKDHIQLCIRNPNCIKAFFIPRSEVDWPSLN